MSSSGDYRVALYILVLAPLLVAGRVGAQETSPPLQSPSTPATDAQGAAATPPTPTPTAFPTTGADKAMNRPAVTPQDFARFDALGEPGIVNIYPPQYESILGDVGGWRSKLADEDISFVVRDSLNLSYDILQNNRPVRPQVYNGQKFTVATHAPNFVFTAGLGRIGLPNAKFVFSGIVYQTTWAPSGPTASRIRGFAYYQSFAEKAVEIKAGYITNYAEFVGVLTGGSPLLVSGLSSLVPIQTGLSADPVATPAFNLTLNGKNGMYFKGGIQRSVSPRGQVYEARNNGIGLDFGSRDAKALFIGEIGMKQAPAENLHQYWFRTGLIYNNSKYARFDGQNSKKNWSAFLAIDYQAIQFDQSAAYRGLFVGASVFYAPADVNVYTQYYEGRAYMLGPFASRASDSMTLNVAYSRFSPDARHASVTQEPPRDQVQISSSYNFRVSKGLFAGPNLAYIHNPSFAGRYNDALNIGFLIFTQF